MASYIAGTFELVWFGIRQTRRINGKCSWGLSEALAQLLLYKSEIHIMKKLYPNPNLLTGATIHYYQLPFI